MNQESMEKVSGYFKALSNPQRLKLFLMVYNSVKNPVPENDICVTQGNNSCSCNGLSKAFTKACEYLNLSRSTISHHFSVLTNAGLISCTRDGQKAICTINEEAVKKIKDFV